MPLIDSGPVRQVQGVSAYSKALPKDLTPLAPTTAGPYALAHRGASGAPTAPASCVSSPPLSSRGRCISSMTCCVPCRVARQGAASQYNCGL